MEQEDKEIVLQPSHVKTYQFIEKYIQKNVVSPHITDIAKAVKITPRQTYRVIEDLRGLGYISKEAYRKHSIKILKPLR